MLKSCRNGLHTYEPAHRECPECRRATRRRYKEKHSAVLSARARLTRARVAEGKAAARASVTHKVCRKAGHRYDSARRSCPVCDRERMARWKSANPSRGREWRQQNADALRANKRRRRAEKSELIKEQMRAWRKANPGKVGAAKRRHYLKHTAKIIAQQKRAARARYAANPAVERAKVLAKLHKRRARLRDSCSPGVTVEQWRDVCAKHQNENGSAICAYCREPCAPEIDHIVPISRGGRDEVGNVLPACKSCNSSKRAKLISEWDRARLLPRATYDALVAHTTAHLGTLSVQAKATSQHGTRSNQRVSGSSQHG